MSPLMLIGAVIVVIIGAVASLLSGGNNNPAPDESTSPEPAIASPTPEIDNGPTLTQPAAGPTSGARATPLPAGAASNSSGSAGGQKWLVMLYQDADDNVLEQDINIDLNEAERVGSTDRVTIVAQMDRYRGGYNGDGNWTGTRRYYVTRDDDLQRVNSQMVADLGEVNMSDPQTLIDFVDWAIKTYPADKYALILSDHGMGWPGGWSDASAGSQGGGTRRSIPLEGAIGNLLYLDQLDQALANIRSQTGVDKLELIGMDACLMGHLEVLNALAPHARYAVVSQETEPSLGWAYTSFLGALAQNPDADGAGLSRAIVSSYIQDDQRIVDEQARTDLVGRSLLGGVYGAPSAGQVASEMERQVTLTAADLLAVPALMDSVNNLSLQLRQASQRDVAKARNYAQSFTSVFGEQVPPSYIDLGNFVELLKQVSNDGNLGQAADGVLAALRRVVIAEKHGADKPGASGVSIYYPSSQLYRNPVTGAPSYTAIANRFAEQSLWDDFLAFHYTGRDFEPSTTGRAVPQQGVAVRGPGAGAINLSPINLSGGVSAGVAAPGKPVTLRTKVSGPNVGYIYFFTGYYDQASNSIFVADQDYLESAQTREVKGVYYPDWGTGDFNLEFEWEPLMYAIADGRQSVQAALAPQTYGASPKDTVYTVDGIYTFTDGSGSRYARLYFRDGQLRQVFVFTGENGTGSPREVTIQRGDQFTVLETWIDLDASGKPAKTETQKGDTITFGDQVLNWKELSAAQGDYLVGFIVEDLDGNKTATYTKVTVK
jgi:hypothetical protein